MHFNIYCNIFIYLRNGDLKAALAHYQHTVATFVQMSKGSSLINFQFRLGYLLFTVPNQAFRAKALELKRVIVRFPE
jgi:hypothetical protein